MPEETNPTEQAPADGAPPPGSTSPNPTPPAPAADAAPAETVTPGGYAYEVVEDGETAPAASMPERKSGGAPWWLLAVAAIVPAVIVGALVWFLFGQDDSGSGSAEVSATNLLHTFTSGGEGTTTTRYEGEPPPGYPEDVPAYDGAEVVGSVLQLQGEDAGYIVVADTSDSRDDVMASLGERFDEDPWQVTAGSDDSDSTAYQFSKTDDPDVTGIVLITSSKDGGRTTIVTSVQQVAGGRDREPEPFEPSASRAAPDGFPEEIPVYEGALLIDASFQNDPNGDAFALSYITQDDADDVLDFYRSELEGADLTVEDGDASASALNGAQAISFSDEELLLQGDVTVGDFGEDDGYTQIDIQVGDER